MKRCPKCKTVKENSDFGKDRRTKNGLKSLCKKCSALGHAKEDKNILQRMISYLEEM